MIKCQRTKSVHNSHGHRYIITPTSFFSMTTPHIIDQFHIHIHFKDIFVYAKTFKEHVCLVIGERVFQ